MGSALLYWKSTSISCCLLFERLYTSTALEHVVSNGVGFTPTTNQVPINFSVMHVGTVLKGGGDGAIVQISQLLCFCCNETK